MKLTKHRFSIPNCIFEDSLTDSEFRLLIFLFYVSSFDGRCDPGYEAMMHYTRSSRSTVYRTLKTLKKNGWIHAIKKGGPKKLSFFLRLPPKLLGMDIKLVPGKLIVLPNL